MIKNKQSDEWRAVQAFCEKKIAEMRADNDNPGLDHDETTLLRGRIMFAQEVLALADDPEPALKVADSSYID
jgi:hypothetical protein